MTQATPLPSDTTFSSWSAYFDSQDPYRSKPLSPTETAEKMHHVAYGLIGLATVVLFTTMLMAAIYAPGIQTVDEKTFLIISSLASYAAAAVFVYQAKKLLEKDYFQDPSYRKSKRDLYLLELLKNGLYAAEMRYTQNLTDVQGKKVKSEYRTYSQLYFFNGTADIIQMLSSRAFNNSCSRLIEKPHRIVLDQLRNKTTQEIVHGIGERRVAG